MCTGATKREPLTIANKNKKSRNTLKEISLDMSEPDSNSMQHVINGKSVSRHIHLYILHPMVVAFD